nr:hypothetical protein [uncultured bacterium]
MLKKIVLFALAGVVGAGLSGCPGLMPPFDTTGAYEGVFSLGTSDVQIADGCDISVELSQNINAGPLENAKVTGTVNLSLTCVASGMTKGTPIEDLLDGILGQLLGVSPLEVEGVLLPNGTLELSTGDLLAECPEGGCEKLILLGQGTDEDGDGKMDSYSGTIGGLVQVSGQIVPLLGEFHTDVTE